MDTTPRREVRAVPGRFAPLTCPPRTRIRSTGAARRTQEKNAARLKSVQGPASVPPVSTRGTSTSNRARDGSRPRGNERFCRRERLHKGQLPQPPTSTLMSSQRRYGNRVLLGLSLLLVVQAVILAVRWSERPLPAPPRFLEEGDALGRVEVESSGDAGTTTLVDIARGQPTVLMVFHSECAQCELVAEPWKHWLETPPPGVAVFLVSREERPAASEYLRGHDWNAPLLRVANPVPGSPELSLVMRTPWLVVTDATGIVRFQDHGSRIAEMSAVLAELHPSTVRRDGSG